MVKITNEILYEKIMHIHEELGRIRKHMEMQNGTLKKNTNFIGQQEIKNWIIFSGMTFIISMLVYLIVGG